uniref:NADP-dependent oxidoreductase domain-containing protein n=1 Tax=Arcella intermedia TaxID=1963864 RepID=A0A6B2LCV4_9EUKA
MFDSASDTGPWYKTETILAQLHPLINREDLTIITKLHPQDHGTHSSEESIKKSLDNLKSTYIDIYLIHFPYCSPNMCNERSEGTWEDSWRVMEHYYEMGILKAIGVSNFQLPDLQKLWNIAKIKPMVVENWYDPYFRDDQVLDFCKSHGIQFFSYSSLGSQWEMKLGYNPIFKDPTLQAIALNHHKSVVQVVLKWLLQKEIVVLPRSHNREHIQQNLYLFDWSLTDTEMQLIDSLKNQYTY